MADAAGVMTAGVGAGAGILDKERTVAGPRFNRWLVPPAALAIHLCIGMAYGFSVFWLPMTKLLAPGPDATSCATQSFFTELFTTSCNWTVPMVSFTFTLFIFMLGVAAALWGGWLEHAGPRKSGFIAALCWGGGMAIGGVGVMMHQLWLVWLGCGILGGVGQGLGYITPVSTLIKWFPDRRGMATGFAIMGYGGGAMIGAPIAVCADGLFRHTAMPPPAWPQTLIAMGAIYFVAMSAGAFGFRTAPEGWRPLGWSPRRGEEQVADHGPPRASRQGLEDAAVLADLGGAVPQRHRRHRRDRHGLADAAGDLRRRCWSAPPAAARSPRRRRRRSLAAAAGLVGLISLFNSVGRLFWASVSDWIGRKNTYFVFFVLGILLYCAMPTLGHMGAAGLFVLTVCIILTMYGGGFATVPAYLADVFGTQMVGRDPRPAAHGVVGGRHHRPGADRQRP